MDDQTSIAIAHKIRPELIIIDIGLPDMDSIQVAQYLRVEAEFDHTPFITLTPTVNRSLATTV